MWVVVMEIVQVSDSVAIHSDGQRLQVIHNPGDKFVLAKQLGIPRQLVNTYKYKWRKGEKL